MLKQLAACMWITSFDNHLETSLLTTYARVVVNKLPQTTQTHPGIGLLQYVVGSCLEFGRKHNG